MYPGQLPPGPPLMGGEQMVYFSSGGGGPFVPSHHPYGPPVSYGAQYPGMPQPGAQVMNCPIPFGAPSPPHWHHMGPAVMPVFGMPPPRQPMPYQSAYSAQNGPAPPPMYMNGTPLPFQQYGQPFRPSPYPPGQAPYVRAPYPGDDVFIVHQDGCGAYPTVPVRGPMHPQCFAPPHNQGGINFISQHPPNMHGMHQQPLIQFSGMPPAGPQQTQSGTFHQQPFVAERAQHKQAEREAVVVTTSHVSQRNKTSRTPSQKAQAMPPIEEVAESANEPGTLPTESLGDDDSVDKSAPSGVTPPKVPEIPPEEEESFSDREIDEEELGNDSLDSDEMLDKSGSSSSQTTLIVSPSSSDGSLTLRSSPVSPMSDDDMSSPVTEDNIPTRDQECSMSQSFAECHKTDNITERDLDKEPKICDRDGESKPVTAVLEKETQPTFKASKQCYVLSGRFGSNIPSSRVANKERNHLSPPSSNRVEGKPCCPTRMPEKVDKLGKPKKTAFIPQKSRKIRSHIDRPVYQEKPSRILSGQVPQPNSPGKEQSSDGNQDHCVRSCLTTHFRLLFEPIPQYHDKAGE